MAQLKIHDLDYQTEISEPEQVRGSGNLNNVKWDSIFKFDFAHNRISSFSIGNIKAFAISIGGIFINS